ncbi:heterogeneous nuclear ribonucleo HRP1 protein [Rutstroemia sp. NJR-2017a WRK4]|nr:heterogeneous nuclear ribonucleo HRP1 protein [Rutstroemia sp. NJR-2017a WRK4]
MTEPENFEEDLFADLYTEDDSTAKPAETVTESNVQPAVVESKVEQPVEETEHNGDGDGDQQMYNGEQDVDDEIDFNLGNGNGGGNGNHDNGYDATSNNHEAHGPGIKEDGKMFIGGLNWETTDQSLKEYFSQFGEVLECTVMRDGASGRSRGFGFLTFKDARTVNIVMVKEHYLDGKIIDPKRAIPRDEQERTSKIFVGGVSQDATEQDFKEYFMQFGRVVDATLMMDKDTGRPRGFGFVTFDSEAAVEACLNSPLEILGKPIEQMAMGGGRGGMPGGMQGMNPAMMAQMAQMQQMQQMQQQMGGGAGARSQSPQSPGAAMAGMNPAMMQQMQQMQMQQMQAMGGGGGGGGGNYVAGGGSNPGGRMGTPGYNAYEQQMFEQQKYEQQQMRRAQRDQSGYGGQGQGGYGMGGPTSWEGMYDDVPQPGSGGGGGGGRGGFGGGRGGGGGGGSQRGSVPPGPQSAPPANAPTGPKNAGKPGANYRGGGRGGSRGFHPYARG